MPDCFICHQPAEVHQLPTMNTFDWLVECPVCTKYTISMSVREDLAQDRSARDLLPYLSAYIRQASSPVQPVRIGHDWRTFARRHAETPVGQKRRRLLEFIAKRSQVPGHAVTIAEGELVPLIDAFDVTELHYLLDHLVARRYIVYNPFPGKPGENLGHRIQVRLEVEGWEAVEPTTGAGVPGTCFVAMAFDPTLNDAYDNGIVPAVSQDCGCEVVRIDRVQHNDDITERILAGIRTAHFVVADFSGQRQSVYFEAGFAAGLGRTVIWSCRDSDFNALHFDTRQHNHIRWSTAADLRQQLTDRIRATVTLPVRLR